MDPKERAENFGRDGVRQRDSQGSQSQLKWSPGSREGCEVLGKHKLCP